MTAHPIVVSDSSLDDGPEFPGGSGVEDQRSVLHLGSTEGAVHPGVAPGLRRAQESRTPAACVPRRLRPSSQPISESPPADREAGCHSCRRSPARRHRPTPSLRSGSPHFPGERLMVCLNPRLSEERRRKCGKLLATTEETLEKIAASVRAGTLKGKAEIGHRVGREAAGWSRSTSGSRSARSA